VAEGRDRSVGSSGLGRRAPRANRLADRDPRPPRSTSSTFEAAEADLLAASCSRRPPLPSRRSERRSTPSPTTNAGRSSPPCSATGQPSPSSRRGFEALRYRFEIVSVLRRFPRLQRHRMLTVQWQRLGPGPRAASPRRFAKRGSRRIRAALEISGNEVRAARRRRPRRVAPVRPLLAFRSRYILTSTRVRRCTCSSLRSGSRGPPHLPCRRPGDARGIAASTPASRGDEVCRRLDEHARADDERAPHPPQAGGRSTPPTRLPSRSARQREARGRSVPALALAALRTDTHDPSPSGSGACSGSGASMPSDSASPAPR